MTTTSSDYTRAALRQAGQTKLERDICRRALAYMRGEPVSLVWVPEWEPFYTQAAQAQRMALDIGYDEDREVSEREAIAVDRIRVTTTHMCVSKPLQTFVFEIPDLMERELLEIMRIHDIQVRAGLPTYPCLDIWDIASTAQAAAGAYVCLRKVKRLIKRALSGSHLANAAVVLACWHSFRLRCLLQEVGPEWFYARTIEDHANRVERMTIVHEKRYGTPEQKKRRDDRILELWTKTVRENKVSKTGADEVVGKRLGVSARKVKRVRLEREKEKLDREKLGH